MSPNPSPPTPAATLSVTYDRDVDGAAEVLLAVLWRSPNRTPGGPPAADPEASTPRPDDEDAAAA
jgi:hypothetical protein